MQCVSVVDGISILLGDFNVITRSDSQSTHIHQEAGFLLDGISMAIYSDAPIPKRLVDSNGWVRIGNKLVFWVPENHRNGLTTDTVMTIPTTSPSRIVRIDFCRFRYGTLWTAVYDETQPN